MAESVECRRQIGVEHPPTFGVGAARRRVDGHDRVVAAPARPKAVRLRLEPGLPLGLQRVDRRACNALSAITGIPSPRRRPLLLGTYTRLTGRGDHGAAWRCTQPARSALSVGTTTTLPSTPAVLRPAFCSVTRRTASSALLRERSISFCKLRTFFRSPARDAAKIRCRSRRTLSS